MNALKTLLVPAILAVSSATYACDYGTCYNSYTPSYGYASYAPSYGYASYQGCSYSNWTYDQGHNYYYCTCSFRAFDYAPYSKYICIYNRNYPKCIYYYNPVAKTYWGCFNLASKGFQTLNPADQRSTIGELPQDKFSAPTASVTIPATQTGEQLTTPPALPADAVAALPAS